jgi:RNA-directed DNA polymerase
MRTTKWSSVLRLKAGIELEELLEQLARSVKAGKKKKIKHLFSKILNSSAAKLSALVRTIYYDPDAPQYTLMELLRRARSLFAYAPIDEAVSLGFKEKHSGELRPVINFGWKRRALQQLCADILKVLLPAYSFDFMEKGNGGADGAAEYLGAIIKEGNYDFVITVDIKNCFRSVNQTKVAQLMPWKVPVTHNVVLIADDVTMRKELPPGGELALHPTVLEADIAARQGIPQGSLVSPLIMSRAVLGPLLNATPFAARVVLHGDDIAVPAKTEEEAKAIYNTLRSLLENECPAGPLPIGFHKIWCVNEYVNFCKYKLRRTPKIFGAEIRYCPSTRSFNRYERNVVKIYLQAPDGEEEQHVAQYSEAWKKAFGPLWQPNELAEDMLAVTTMNAMSDAWKIKHQASTKCTL